MTKPPSRYFYIDVLRANAIIAVVIMHNAVDYVEKYNKIPFADWLPACIYNGLTRFCVPMFVMLSGALLLNKDKDVSIRDLFKKRLSKLVIPLVFWSVVYVVFQNYMGHSLKPISFTGTLLALYKGPVVFHFWFLYMMIGIYLIYPVINGFIRSATQSQVLYFLVIWFAVNCVISMSAIATDVWWGFDTNGFGGYIGYFVLGFYLKNYNIPKRKLTFIYLVGVFGLLISLAAIPFFQVNQIKKGNEIVENDFTPELPFVAGAIYLFLKNRFESFNPKPGWGKTIITAVSKDSYGIYIVHVLVMQLLFVKTLPFFKFESLGNAVNIPLKTVIILLLSYLLVRLLRLIPLIKNTI